MCRYVVIVTYLENFAYRNNEASYVMFIFSIIFYIISEGSREPRKHSG